MFHVEGPRIRMPSFMCFTCGARGVEVEVEVGMQREADVEAQVDVEAAAQKSLVAC